MAVAYAIRQLLAGMAGRSAHLVAVVRIERWSRG